MALPIATGDRPLDADTAAAIRIAALCLAAKLGSFNHIPEIAAGVTLLERRDNGESPVTETIMVALA